MQLLDSKRVVHMESWNIVRIHDFTRAGRTTHTYQTPSRVLCFDVIDEKLYLAGQSSVRNKICEILKN